MLQAYRQELIDVRRALHAYPEEGWTEFCTTARIVQRLRSWGCRVLLGPEVLSAEHCLGRDPALVQAAIERARAHGVSEALLAQMQGLTGCVAVIDTDRPGPTLAARFDIDCVPVTESTDCAHVPTREGFASQNPGLMHACGHDAHTAVGLAFCHWLMEHKDRLCGKIKVLFQPAEEGVRGAAGMVAAGVVDDCDYFLASHCGVGAASGEVLTNFTGFLCTSKLDVTFEGKPAHAGACPQDGRNALAAAAHAVVQMLGISRHSDGMTRINVGQLIAGEGRNVIPSKAVMKLEVRGQTRDIHDYMLREVEHICQGVATSFGVQFATSIVGQAVDLTPDAELVDTLNRSCEQVPGVRALAQTQAFGGSEDATLLARRVQDCGGKAAFFVWGTQTVSGHHTSTFDVSEGDMSTALAVWVHAAQLLVGAPTQS